jgi:hypothetical protein
MQIHDPYLQDRERIVKRVGAYIDLSLEGGELERVTVQTRDAGRGYGSHDEQNRAIEELKRKYPSLVDFNRKGAEHDRWIEVTHKDGTKARMLIGRGLDFIRSDGTVEPTWIVIQDPVQ